MNALPPFWVISLEAAHNRRVFVQRGFDDLGLAFEWIDAVDGSLLTAEQRRRYSRVRALFEVGRPLTTGDVGCTLSHLAAYRRQVDERIPEVVLFEDDAVPTRDLVAVLEARGDFPADWDIVNFMPLTRREPAHPVGIPLVDGRYRVQTYARNPYGASCYLVRLEAARRLLRVGDPISMLPDDLFFRDKPAALRMYGIEPSPVVHGDFPSERFGRDSAITPRGSSVRLWERPVVLAGKVVHRVRRVRAVVASAGGRRGRTTAG